MDEDPIQGGVEILLVAACCRNRDKRDNQLSLCRVYLLPLFILT